MNLRTQIMLVFVLWLVMGLGFLSAYMEGRRRNTPRLKRWMSTEGILFILSVIIPLIIMAGYN